jgi:uncharacterized protein YkwD
MRRTPLLAALVSIAALAGPPAAGASSCQGGDVRPAADNLPEIAQTTLCLINAERAQAGLPGVREQEQLTRASADFSAQMVAERFFAHDAPDGTTLTQRLNRAGYLGQPGSWLVGENIAWGESYLATPAAIVRAWMNSPPHKANILRVDYEEIGLGIALGTPRTPHPGATYTTDFGTRRIPDPQVTEARGEVTVGDVTPRPTSGTRGVRATGTHGAPRRSRPAGRRASGRCARRVTRARAGRAARKVRCVRTWRVVGRFL